MQLFQFVRIPHDGDTEGEFGHFMVRMADYIHERLCLLLRQIAFTPQDGLRPPPRLPRTEIHDDPVRKCKIHTHQYGKQ